MNNPFTFILIRGGGDLASGVALRLHRVGLNLIITERPQPLAVRRLVSFGEAVYRGQITVEGLTARRAQNLEETLTVLSEGQIPVVVDPNLELFATADPYFPRPITIVDGRMLKTPPEIGIEAAPLVIGLGPGFIAGENCHAAIETNRGHYLGRVLWSGAPQSDTGIPAAVAQHQADRVLRSPADGIFYARVEIGSRVKKGQVIAEVFGKPIIVPFDGVLRGLLHDGLAVERGTKVGDLDPRADLRLARMVSEKSLAIGGGVLEALLTRPEIRAQLWN